jgi:hypothetical protein
MAAMGVAGTGISVVGTNTEVPKAQLAYKEPIVYECI